MLHGRLFSPRKIPFKSRRLYSASDISICNINDLLFQKVIMGINTKLKKKIKPCRSEEIAEFPTPRKLLLQQRARIHGNRSPHCHDNKKYIILGELLKGKYTFR